MESEKQNLGRILYAEDDEPYRVLISKLLQREGYTCVTAPDGIAAAQMLREGQFECLISDIEMLGNADFEFIRAVPQIQAGLPVILLTGHPSVESAVESLQLQVVAYLVKPVDFPVLLVAVREAVLRSLLLRQFEVTRASLQQWLSDMAQLADGLKRAPRVAVAAPMDVYLMVTYRNILEALLGLKTLMEHSLSTPPPASQSEPHGATPLLLIDALRDAIEVLEKTKDAFRSRELGDLRHRLEDLLHASKDQKQSHKL